MKYSLSLFLFSALAASLALPQSNTTAVPTANKPVPKTATSSKKTVSSKKGKSSKKPVATAATSRYRQMAPTPDRYKEIQQALAEKGYLKSDPNGVWDSQSTDALRQFQTDKKLSPTGKLSSASLIALGLGPRTEAGSSGQSPGPAETAPGISVPAAPVPMPEN
jgi:hypothetical protein